MPQRCRDGQPALQCRTCLRCQVAFQRLNGGDTHPMEGVVGGKTTESVRIGEGSKNMINDDRARMVRRPMDDFRTDDRGRIVKERGNDIIAFTKRRQ